MATQQQRTITSEVQLVEPRHPSREGRRAWQPSGAAWFKRAWAFIRRVGEGLVRGERELEKETRRVADIIQHREVWLNQRKVGMHIVGYANLGEIGFIWRAQEKDVLQRLWWWHPAHPERPTLATEYRHTLLLPAVDAAPPLP